MMSLMSGNHVDRREFLATSVGLAAAALSSAPVGASPNDRIRHRHRRLRRPRDIPAESGAGSRARTDPAGRPLRRLDAWRARRLAALVAEKLPGQTPPPVSRHQDLLATRRASTRVIIATPDHAHLRVLRRRRRAPARTRSSRSRSACGSTTPCAALDVVKAATGSSRSARSGAAAPSFKAAEQYVQSGALGPHQQGRNGVEPQRRELESVGRHGAPADVDWEQYQMDLPKRPSTRCAIAAGSGTTSTRPDSSACSAAT